MKNVFSLLTFQSSKKMSWFKTNFKTFYKSVVHYVQNFHLFSHSRYINSLMPSIFYRLSHYLLLTQYQSYCFLNIHISTALSTILYI